MITPPAPYNRPFSVMFHHFHGGRHAVGQGSISADDFDQLLDWITARFYLITPDEWLERTKKGTLRNLDVCLSFDDTLRCQYEIALPVLDSFNAKAFWFVYTSVLHGQVEKLELYRYFRTVSFSNINEFYEAFEKALWQSPYCEGLEAALIEFNPAAYLAEFPFYSIGDKRFRYMRDEILGPERYNALMDAMIVASGMKSESLHELLWMDRKSILSLEQGGHTVGLHSHTHPMRIGQLPRHEQQWQYEMNSNTLKEITGTTPVSMSHPVCSYSAETLELLSALGIQVGFRSNMSRPTTSNLEFPREDHITMMKLMRAVD